MIVSTDIRAISLLDNKDFFFTDNFKTFDKPTKEGEEDNVGTEDDVSRHMEVDDQDKEDSFEDDASNHSADEGKSR